MTMKKTIILILVCVCIAASASAQRGSGRLSLGVGLLYKTVMRGNFSPTATCNGPNVPRANISARIHFGATIAPTASVWPTSPVSPGDATTTAACASVLRQGATPGSSSAVCISATNTTMRCGPDGHSTGR